MEKGLKQILEVVPHVMRLPSKHVWIDYDKEADVVYINFQKPQMATDSELLDNNILIRTMDGKVVGITIMNASSMSPM